MHFTPIYREPKEPGRRLNAPGKLYSLEHRIGAHFIEDGRVWDAQDAVNDVHVAVRLGNIRLNERRIDTGTFNGHRLVSATIGDDIEVEFLVVGDRLVLRQLY